MTAEPANSEAARLFGNGGDAVVLAGTGPTRSRAVVAAATGRCGRGRIAALARLPLFGTSEALTY